MGQRIRREWTVEELPGRASSFFEKVAEPSPRRKATTPDLHLVGYRNVAIEIWTHAIGGLSENDFILAAKVDAIPILVKKTSS